MNCQTQRALSGQLGDAGKMSQPTPVPALPEIKDTPTTSMAEPKTTLTEVETTATKPQTAPTATEEVPTTKAKVESVMTETMVTKPSTQSELETTPTFTTAEVSPTTEENQPLAAEPFIPSAMEKQLADETTEVKESDIKSSETASMEKKEQEIMNVSEEELTKVEESKPALPSTESEALVSAVSSSQMNEAENVPISTITAEVKVTRIVAETETKPEPSFPGGIITEIQPDEHIKLTEPKESLQQVELQPKSEEQQLVVKETVMEADVKEVIDKTVENITDVTSTPESTPVSTETQIIEVRSTIHYHCKMITVQFNTVQQCFL